MNEFSLLDIGEYDDQWWIGVLKIEHECFNGHFFYIEHERYRGMWKFDLFWLRPFIIREP